MYLIIYLTLLYGQMNDSEFLVLSSWDNRQNNKYGGQRIDICFEVYSKI